MKSSQFEDKSGPKNGVFRPLLWPKVLQKCRSPSRDAGSVVKKCQNGTFWRFLKRAQNTYEVLTCFRDAKNVKNTVFHVFPWFQGSGNEDYSYWSAWPKSWKCEKTRFSAFFHVFSRFCEKWLIIRPGPLHFSDFRLKKSKIGNFCTRPQGGSGHTAGWVLVVRQASPPAMLILR